jgi:hypothetical protein
MSPGGRISAWVLNAAPIANAQFSDIDRKGEQRAVDAEAAHLCSLRMFSARLPFQRESAE